MKFILSPAKKLDFVNIDKDLPSYPPVFADQANQLMAKLKEYTPGDLQELMDLSPDLAGLNWERHSRWSKGHDLENSNHASRAFQGEVFRKMGSLSLTKEDYTFAQDKLFILSGLYGVLRPLDLVQAYRLEMGTKLQNDLGKDLYAFWGNRLTGFINENTDEGEELVNLASNEYFKALDKNSLKPKVIKPVFKDYKNGKLKVIFIYAKQARGLMGRFIIKERIDKAEDLKHFHEEGYHYDENLSTTDTWVFTR